MVEKYKGEADLKVIRAHIHKFLHSGLKEYTDLRDELVNAKSTEEIRVVVENMKERRKEQRPETKLGWYYRYWKSMNIDKSVTGTYTFEDWTPFIERDPVLNKKKSTSKVNE